MKKSISILIITVAVSLPSAAQRTDTLKVKVHNHVMTLYALGAGSPAVILEAGGASNHKTWDSVRTKLANLTKGISYDRPGYLNSDTCSSRRDAVTVAKELREGLIKAGIKPPYVLAGLSMGGAFVRVFAGLFPKDVVGLVLVDPAPEESYARFDKEQPDIWKEAEKYLVQVLNSNRAGEREEMRFFDSSMNQARRSDVKHSTPTYLLIAAGKAAGGQDRDPSNPLNKIWIEELEKWAKKRPNLTYEIIRNSGHNIARFQPDTVVHAVRHMVQQFQMKKLKQVATPYKKPVQLNDGISTATLKEVGIDENKIIAATDSITKGVYPNIHSLLIIRNNKLVYENYFPGNDVIFGKGAVGFINNGRDSLHDIRSITKSVVSAAVMIAIGQKKIKSVEERVFDFFPEFAKYDTGAKRQLTIRHLLTMSSGIEWDESMSYADTMNSEVRMHKAKDPVEYFLSQRLIHKPGETFNYSGGCTQTLAAIVTKATGMRIDHFVQKFLFRTLGITTFEWVKRPDSIPKAASGLRLRSRDMVKLGLLYMNEGKWKNKRIIPADLVKESLKLQIEREKPHGYGYQFWLWTDTVMKTPVTTVQADGNGNQRIAINKQLDLVIVITAGNYNRKDRFKNSDDLYLDFIYPAVMQENKRNKKK